MVSCPRLRRGLLAHVILDIGSPCAPSKRDPLNSEVMSAVRVSAAPVSCSLSSVPADFPHPNCVIPRSR